MLIVFFLFYIFFPNRARKEHRRQHYPLQVWLPDWVAMSANILAPLKIRRDREGECTIRHTIIRYAQQNKKETTQLHSNAFSSDTIRLLFNLHIYLFFLLIYLYIYIYIINHNIFIYFIFTKQKRFIIIIMIIFLIYFFLFIFLFFLNIIFVLFIFSFLCFFVSFANLCYRTSYLSPMWIADTCIPARYVRETDWTSLIYTNIYRLQKKRFFGIIIEYTSTKYNCLEYL